MSVEQSAQSSRPTTFAELQAIMRGTGWTTMASMNDAIYYFRSFLGQCDVRWESPHLDTPRTTRRIIVAGKSAFISKKASVFDHANGVIFEYPGWNILAAPPQRLYSSKNVSKSSIISQCEKYSVYKIHDGTCVTLYYFAGKWRLSTAHGYDVSDYCWTGSKTFVQALETAAKLPFDKMCEELDTSRFYYVIFRCHDYQPLLSDPEGVWMAGGILETTPPSWATVDAADKLNARSYDEIVLKCDNSMYSAAVTSSYGYILRGVDDTTPSIIFESRLLQKIRRYVYDVGKTIPPLTRQYYVILRAFINYQNRAGFIVLFPQFKSVYAKLESEFTIIIDRLRLAMKFQEVMSKITDTLIVSHPYDKIIRVLAGRMNEINPHSDIAINLIQDQIYSADFLELYFENISINTSPTNCD